MPVLLTSAVSAASAIAAAAASVAVTTPQAGMVDAPCAPRPGVSEAERQAAAVLLAPGGIDPKIKAAYLAPAAVEARARAEAEQKAQDWPNLCKYRAANQAIEASGARPRVVFMGDSISELWNAADPALFQGRIVNRGISGQTTAQMVVRFYADVVRLHPRVVHLLS
ncbi:MAG: hypothetical protein ACYDD1_08025, partial [Caulobacteraceae bacterium]